MNDTVYFWLGADGEVTECDENEFNALIDEANDEADKWRKLTPSVVDQYPEQYSFWGIDETADESE